MSADTLTAIADWLFVAPYALVGIGCGVGAVAMFRSAIRETDAIKVAKFFIAGLLTLGAPMFLSLGLRMIAALIGEAS